MTLAFDKGLLKKSIISRRPVKKEIDLVCDIR